MRWRLASSSTVALWGFQLGRENIQWKHQLLVTIYLSYYIRRDSFLREPRRWPVPPPSTLPASAREYPTPRFGVPAVRGKNLTAFSPNATPRLGSGHALRNPPQLSTCTIHARRPCVGSLPVFHRTMGRVHYAFGDGRDPCVFGACRATRADRPRSNGEGGVGGKSSGKGNIIVLWQGVSRVSTPRPGKENGLDSKLPRATSYVLAYVPCAPSGLPPAGLPGCSGTSATPSFRPFAPSKFICR